MLKTYMKSIQLKPRLALLATALLAGTSLNASGAAAEPLTRIKADVAAAITPVTHWDGPTTGPTAAKGKFIVYVFDTRTNAGSVGTADGATEAAKALGWKFQVIDGQNNASGEEDALEQAIALKPDGILIGSLDATQFKSGFARAAKQGIKMVSWHSAAEPGPISNVPEIFWNISSDPYKIGNMAAKFAVASSDGRANAAILWDPQFAIVRTKTKGEEDGIHACATCTILSVENAPYTQISQRMPSLMSALLQRYPNKLNYVLAFNDLYFDFSVPTLRGAGIAAGDPPFLISAGDGSVSAYERIRKRQYQVATVPEPLLLEGWQAMDEFNRAFHGQKPSGYVPSIHLVTKSNIDADGGTDNRFDPNNDYRDHYKKIWGLE